MYKYISNDLFTGEVSTVYLCCFPKKMFMFICQSKNIPKSNVKFYKSTKYFDTMTIRWNTMKLHLCALLVDFTRQVVIFYHLKKFFSLGIDTPSTSFEARKMYFSIGTKIMLRFL